MREEILTSTSTHEESQGASFRGAAAAFMRAESDSEALTALDALRCTGRAPAIWECVNESLFGAGELSLLRGDDLRRELVLTLSKGTPSQMEDLARWVAGVRLPLSHRDQIAAEVMGASVEVRGEWFRKLVSDSPLERICAVDLLSSVTPGALSERESMAVASYLFSGCADDHGVVLMEQGARALTPFPFSADRVAHFFARHCSEGALSVAERTMERNRMISFVATRMLVEYGRKENREAAFSFIVSRDRLLFGGFEGWSQKAIASIEPKLTGLLKDLTASGSVLAGAVRALERLPGSVEKNELLIRAAVSRARDTDLIDAISSFFTSGDVAPEVLDFAREILDPPKAGFSWFKGPSSHFGYCRPQPDLVELAIKVLETAEERGRHDLYRRALSAWDISGLWIHGAMRVVVATLLPLGELGSEVEVLTASDSQMERACERHRGRLLEFAGNSSLDAAERIIEGVMRAGFTRPEFAFEVYVALECMGKRVREEESLSPLVAFVMSLGWRFPSSAVRVHVCARFYDTLECIPRGLAAAVRDRLAECQAELAEAGMGVAQAELDALKRLMIRDSLRQ